MSTKSKRRRRGKLVRFFLDPAIAVLLWLWFTLTWPFWIFQVGVIRFASAVGRWWSTRDFWLLLAGLPAILVMIFSGYVLGAIALQDPRQLVERYRKAAKRTMEAGQFPAAKIYLERVLEFQRGDRDALFDLAKAAANTNDSPRAASAMLQLAPEDRAVYGPAHLWQATRLLSHKPLTIREVRVAEIHLNYALQLNENTPLAHRLLGEIYFQQGLWGQAIPHLTISSIGDRALSLQLARAYAITGNKDKAKRFGEEARDFFAKQSAARPQDMQLKVDWADSCLFLEEFPEAIQLLRDALTLREDLSARQALARVYIAWSDSLAGNTVEVRQQKFSLLAAGIQEYPDDLTLFSRVMQLSESDEVTVDAAKTLLNANLLEGKAVGLSHLILGALDFKIGKADDAARHLERAYDVLPNAEIVANNLAWLLIHANPPQPERALQLIDPCIRRMPTMVRFRDTRGHALLKLGRFREAANDLEAALAVLRSSPGTHVALADAYQQLGLADLAEQHRNRATALAAAAINRANP